MASIYQAKTAPGQPWIVSVFLGRVNGSTRATTRRFPTRQAAEEYERTLPSRDRTGRGRRPRSRAQVVDYLAANFEVSPEGCWEWTGKLINSGYARATWTRPGLPVVRGGHRLVLEALGFPVPTDKVIDHLCRNRKCINPDHLDVVTGRENIMRSPIAPGALNAAKTHCPHGHEYTPENTLVQVNPGGRKTTTRVCRTCQRGWIAKSAARRAAKAVSA